MLTIPHCKESLSRAFVTAVVGRARHKVNWNSEFDYGIDGYVRMIELRGVRHAETGFGFDFQAKTTTDWSLQGNEIVYDLEASAFNDLVNRAGSGTQPFLLILLCLHSDEAQWLNVTEESLILKKCAYWCKLVGPPTENTATQRIRISEANVFTPEAVIQILEDIRTGAIVP